MRVIALEEHMFPHDVLVAANLDLGSRAGRKGAELDDLGEGRLRTMDAAGVDVQVLSGVSHIVQELPPEQSIEVSRTLNNRMAATIDAYPDRFKAFATLPMSSPESAIVEFRRTVENLGFIGAMIYGQTAGAFLDHEAFQPILECAVHLGVPIYLHPAAPPPAVREAYFYGLKPPVSAALATAGWGWHAECGMHVLRMIVAGVFERFPELQLIVGHMGEGLPFSLARADEMLSPVLSDHDASVAETMHRNVHITTSGYTTVAPLLCALMVLGADRILFSVDHPFSDSEHATKFLYSAPISPDDRHKISHGNAERMFGL
jgi:predicted TIM-barrel fold metal-dependent hydrolase